MEMAIGFKVNGEPISTLRYTDDTVILPDSIESLQLYLDKLNSGGKKMGLEINTRKKVTVFSRGRN